MKGGKKGRKMRVLKIHKKAPIRKKRALKKKAPDAMSEPKKTPI